MFRLVTTALLVVGLAAGETSVDSFDYTVEDSGGSQDTATVSVTITGTNDDPTVATALSDFTFDEDSTGNALTGISIGDADDFGQTMTVVVEVPADTGALEATAAGAALGQIEKQFGKGSVMRMGDAGVALRDPLGSYYNPGIPGLYATDRISRAQHHGQIVYEIP